MNKNVGKYIVLILNAVLSGIMISVGGAVYLLCENKIIGSFLFSFGLFTIVQRGFALYTGKVGYIPENSPVYIIETLITLIGNIAGTALTAILLQHTRFSQTLHEKAAVCMAAKTSDSIASQLILGAFCGMLMYLAVDNAKESRKKKADMSFVFGICIPVMIFIICGFNHSIADAFYMFSTGTFPEDIPYILTVAAGNAAGGMMIPLIKKITPI
ncbi:formate/nitrite transporter family protein [Ruminococcus sp.]|uniref:formate/nitrite transporter family protein n=1 Tax=Ruminococcus sp. TaxID=41978 RepID=UPI0025F62379|nr:formate/nitrite transporter family protein [Ruminococcus sp.]MCR4640220.1 formate/nitrite transporter family protein [Ruminococcus sp.]